MEILKVEFLSLGFQKEVEEWLSITEPKRIKICAKFKKKDPLDYRGYSNVIQLDVDISHTNLFKDYLLNELKLELKIIERIKMYILNTSKKELKWD